MFADLITLFALFAVAMTVRNVVHLVATFHYRDLIDAWTWIKARLARKSFPRARIVQRYDAWQWLMRLLYITGGMLLAVIGILTAVGTAAYIQLFIFLVCMR